MTPEAQVIQVKEYELVDTPDAFVEAITHSPTEPKRRDTPECSPIGST